MATEEQSVVPHDRTTLAALEPTAPSRTRTRIVTAVSATVVGMPLAFGATAPAQAAPAFSLPAPPSKALPAGLDVAPPYQRGTRCLTQPLPGVVAFAKMLNNHYGSRAYGIEPPRVQCTVSSPGSGCCRGLI